MIQNIDEALQYLKKRKKLLNQAAICRYAKIRHDSWTFILNDKQKIVSGKKYDLKLDKEQEKKLIKYINTKIFLQKSLEK